MTRKTTPATAKGSSVVLCEFVELSISPSFHFLQERVYVEHSYLCVCCHISCQWIFWGKFVRQTRGYVCHFFQPFSLKSQKEIALYNMSSVIGRRWIKQMFIGAFLIPAMVCGVAFFINFIAIYYHASRAIPFGTMVSPDQTNRDALSRMIYNFVQNVRYNLPEL